MTADAAAELTRVTATLAPGSPAMALRQHWLKPKPVAVPFAAAPPERLSWFQPLGHDGAVAEPCAMKSSSRSCGRPVAGMTGGVAYVVPVPLALATVPAARS